MYPLGHYGLALLLMSIISSLLHFPLLMILWMCGIAAIITKLPDKDINLGKHRGVTHTLLFATVVSIIIGLIVHIIFTNVEPTLIKIPIVWQNLQTNNPGFFMMGFIPSAVGLFSHLLGDLFNHSGVPLLWPFERNKRYSLSLFQSSNTIANVIFGVVGFTVFLLTIWFAV